VTWKPLHRVDGPYTSSLQNLVTPMYSRPIQFSVRFLKTHIQFGTGTLLPFRGAIAATQAGDANYLFRWSPLRVACCCDTICARRLMLTKRIRYVSTITLASVNRWGINLSDTLDHAPNPYQTHHMNINEMSYLQKKIQKWDKNEHKSCFRSRLHYLPLQQQV